MSAISATPSGKPAKTAQPQQPLVSSKEIWSLTLPQAVTMLLQFTIGFTDVVVAGRIHPHLQGALGIITQLQFFFLVLGIALVNGGIAAMSQSLGARLPLRAQRYAGLLFIVGGFFCALTMIAGYAFADEMMFLMQVPAEIYDITLDLWLCYLPILPASYLAFISVGIFRAHKNVWTPLLSALIVCVLNAFADLGFGLGMFGLPNMGGRGLILASIVSVASGALFNLSVLVRKAMITRKSFAPWRWEKQAFPYILRVATPAGGSQLLWQLGYLVLFLITSTLPKDSVIAVSGLTAGMRIEAIIFMPAMAFSFTASILVGHCLGSGKPDEAKRIARKIILTGALGMAVLALCLYPFVPWITAFVAPEDVAVQDTAALYMLFNLVAAPFTVTSLIMSGVFTGAGATLFSLLAFSTGTWGVRLPLAWYMGHVLWQDASGVFIAMLASQVVQAFLCLYLFSCKNWQRYASTARRLDRKTAAA
ncbi:MATE family efflux transporter [Desulfovibrio sp. OttesenSCG-928-G15]|nr:MATE family efflux transporter [Desulfovibrio sp. OttesenSCG-928-G15]